MLVNESQPEKASFPIVTTVLGIITLVILSLFSNTPSAMSVTPFGIRIAPSGFETFQLRRVVPTISASAVEFVGSELPVPSLPGPFTRTVQLYPFYMYPFLKKRKMGRFSFPFLLFYQMGSSLIVKKIEEN